MNAERWNQVQTLFKEIVELDHDSRTTRLEKLLDTDPDLYREIESLLAADADRTSILDGFALDSIDISSLFFREGTRIGSFQIVKQIGSGGMGNVYLAGRIEGGFEQTVALKLIKFGVGSDQAVRRFEAERSILARLQHPHIARLVDGGLTEQDHPWFAMEYVEGENILSWCRRLELSTEKRLELFLDVIEAVQYAHKNLVVHRDLKPGNILVTGDEEKPQIKLLDFGIARMLQESEAEQPGGRAMTRAYASPEQIRGESTSTATDIYSLGVVLHQLVTGCHPEVEYRTEDCHPAPINRELQAICNKAMHADAASRYENASDLGDDIKAWMKHQPVAAFSQRSSYRLSKWIKRNRAASFIGIFSLVTLILLVFIYTLELKEETERAQDEAVRASRIAQVLGSSLQSIDPMQNGGEELSARAMVDMSTTFINSQLQDDPRTRSDLLNIMANIYANLIAYDVADSISNQALELRRGVQDTTSFSYIDLLAKRSVIMDRAGDFDEAKALIDQAVYLANEHLSPGSLEFASVHLDYIYYLDGAAEYARADSILSMLEPIYEKNRELAAEDYDHYVFYLGTNHRRLGNYEQAEKYLFESLELSRARYPNVHEQIASTLNHISSLYQNMGDYEKALPYAIESYEMRKEIFGSNHLNTMASHANTARTYSGAGMLEKAAETYRDVIAIFRQEYGNENFYIAGLLQSYGNVFIRMGDYGQAETVISESLEHSERLLPEGHLRHAYPLKGMADALKGQKRYSEALTYAERAFQIRGPQLPESDPLLISTRHILGYCLWQLDRRDEAEPHLRESLAFYETDAERYEDEIAEIRELGF